METQFGKKEFFKYVIPSVASMLVFCLYSIVDAIFIAKGVGEYAVAAVNISMPYSNIMFGISVMFSVGTSTACSILIGRGQLKRARRIATQNAIVIGIISIILTVLAQIFIDELAGFLGASNETKIYVIEYLRIISFFSICYMVSYCFEVLIKADGHPRKGAVIIISCSVCNIILDYIFIFKLNLGITGAALATGISQLSSLSCFLLHFISKSANIKPLFSKPHLSIYHQILKLGIPDFLNEISIGFTILIYNKTLFPTTGSKGIIAFAVIAYVYQLIAMLITGIGQGMQPLASYYYGKEETKKSKAYFKLGIITAFVVGFSSYGICNIFAEQITSLIIKGGSQNFAYTVFSMKKFSTVYFFLGINLITAAYFTATNKPNFAIIISALRGLILISASSVFLVYVLGGESVWFAAALSEFICAIVSVTFIKKKYTLSL